MPAFDAQVRKALIEQLAEAHQLAASPVAIRMNESRELLVRHIRLLETLLHGKPTTKIELRHNP